MEMETAPLFYSGFPFSERPESRAEALARVSAMAYVWGRQDAGESARDTGYSDTFGRVYALTQRVTGGYAMPLQSAHHEWTETGRVLVRESETRRIYQIATEGLNNEVMARPVPWADEFLPYWSGLIRKPVAAE